MVELIMLFLIMGAPGSELNKYYMKYSGSTKHAGLKVSCINGPNKGDTLKELLTTTKSDLIL